MVAKPCPFCGHEIPDDLDDYLYPSSSSDKRGNISTLWHMGCNESNGGCSAGVLGYTPLDALNEWNRRPTVVIPAIKEMIQYWGN